MARYTELLDQVLLEKIHEAGYELVVENDAHEKGITFSFHKEIGHYVIVLNIFFNHAENGITITTVDLYEEELGQFPAFIDSEGNVSGLRREPCILVNDKNGRVHDLLEEWDNNAVELAEYYNNIHDKILLTRKYSSPIEPVANSSTYVTEKVGRNDPCPCGSGKKYKHCCID